MSRSFNIKVCGMKNQNNISDLLKLNIDFIGFIFQENSKRYIVNENISEYISKIKAVKKVGVFVNTTIDDVLKKHEKYKLDYIQLHGNESVDYCKQLKSDAFKIIKVFHINNSFDFTICDKYENVCDYFLFDTKTEQYGGSGKQFNWCLLKAYKNKKQYFLSGGISLTNVEQLKFLNDDRIYAIDINSKFENENGLKKMNEIKEFINRISLLRK